VTVQVGVAHHATVTDRGPPGPRRGSPAAATPASRPRSAERSEGSLARRGRAEAMPTCHHRPSLTRHHQRSRCSSEAHPNPG
jgi:hypothetical protein